MIIIRIKAGIGNQLFQYALYKKFELMGKDVAVDLHYYDMPKEKRSFRDYELPLLGLHPRVAVENDIVRLAGTETIMNKIVRRMGLRSSYIREKDLRFQEDILKKENVYLNGYWQSDRYFADIRETLLEEIQYPEDKKAINADLYKEICSSQSVCVTIRRGDYVVNPRYKKKYFSCNEAYFEKGMARIKDQVKDAVFFAFSDDIEWVKENVNFPGKVFFERGDDPVYEKMRLMSACKHFIISNSSFSWWVQYLSANPDKIVYAPRQWYPDGTRTDIYQKNWSYE